MRRIFTLITFASVSLAASAQNGQIWNGGFENWTTDTVYLTPSNWKSSNSEEYQGLVLTEQSADAQHLSFSVKLSNAVNNGTDTLFGYVYQGAVDMSGNFHGVPYASPFDQVTGYYKSSLLTGDSAFVICIKFFGGSPYPPVIAPIGGTTTGWTQFTFPVTAGPCDSVFIGMTSSNPFDRTNFKSGSSIMFDNISFVNTLGPPPLPLNNPSFETWNTVTSSDPDYWYSLNSFVASQGVAFVTSTTDAYAGTKAAQLETKYIALFNDTIPGFVSNGAINPNASNPFTPIAYNALPTTFTGYYKYAPSGSDAAEINVEFFQAGSTIGGYYTSIPAAAASYTAVGGAVNLSGTPDSMIVWANAGNNPGSILKIDAFSLSGGNVYVEELARKLGFSIYPNPTLGILNLAWESTTNDVMKLEIFDLSGRHVFHVSLNATQGNNLKQVDLGLLSAGSYTYRLSGAGYYETGRFVKQ